MRRPWARASRVVRWGGLGVAVLIAAALVLSLYSVAIYDHSRFSLQTEFGVAYASWYRTPRTDPKGWYLQWNGRRDHHKFLNFGSSFSSEDYSAAIPLWLPSACMLTLSGIAWWRWIGPRRLAKVGMCRGCGYDLAGLGAAPCPECGAKPPA